MSMLPATRKLFSRLKEWQSFLPDVPRFQPVPRQSWKSGEKRGEVVLFTGCVMDILYNHVNHACQRLLVDQRQIVRVPEQTCCGALAFHAGEEDIARQLAKRNIEMLEPVAGAIVVTAAGCGAMLKGYGELLEHDEQWKERAADFSRRVLDITEFLAAHEFSSPPQAVQRKIAYHAACHLAHAQNIHNQPQELLKDLPGVSLIPLEEAEHCCGSAGIYNLTHPTLSQQILERKVEHLRATGADTVVTTNPGCMMQLDAGLRAAGLPIKTRHLAEVLDEIYCQQQ